MNRNAADLWIRFWEAALLICAAFGVANGFVPEQHLPWTPLDLNRPVGAATAPKVAQLEIDRAADAAQVEKQTVACMQKLSDAGVQVERVPDKDDGGFCIVRGAVRITGGAVTPIAPAGLVMQCPLAVRYVIWDRSVLQPAARSTMGSPVARVDAFGTYSCRRIYGSADTNDRPSEHARANALDVGGVTLKDGRKVAVEADWRGDGPAGRPGAALLKQLHDGACKAFSTVLSPDYNAAHKDHLHLDGSPTGLCA